MELSICIVTHNHEDSIETCVESIIRYINVQNYEIIIVDDNSNDNTLQKINKFKKYKNISFFYNNKSKSLSYNNNFAASKSKGEFILFLNPDIYFTKETDIKALMNLLQSNTDIGSIACLLKSKDGSIQESFRRFQTIGDFLQRGILGRVNEKYHNRILSYIKKNKPVSVDWLLGAFLMIRRELFFLLNGFDLRYRLYYEDVDLCYRIRKIGKKNILYPNTFVIHEYNRSSAGNLFSKYKFYHFFSFFKFRTIVFKQKLYDTFMRGE